MGDYVAHTPQFGRLSLKTFFVLVLLGIGFILFPTLSHAQRTGTIDDYFKYAWSENIGWINFKPSGVVVIVDDTKITGYIWSENHGWINLQPVNGGVTNTPNGELGGMAWGEHTGWIDFSEAWIDQDGFFWGYLDGPLIGKTTLNCANTDSCGVFDFRVRTNWRPFELGINQESAERYAWGPDGERDEFRSNTDLGVSKAEFDAAYKKSLEHAIQIDMGKLSDINQFATDSGEVTYAQYSPGRVAMDQFGNDTGFRVLYRRDPRNIDASYLTSAEKKNPDDTIYDQIRQKVFDTDFNAPQTPESPNQTRGIGSRQFVQGNADIQTAIRARQRRIEKEREKQKLLKQLQETDISDNETREEIEAEIEQIEKEIEKDDQVLKEIQGSLEKNLSSEPLAALYEFLKTSLFNFLQK